MLIKIYCWIILNPAYNNYLSMESTGYPDGFSPDS